MNRNSIGSRARSILVGAYWLLTATILADALASLGVPSNDLTGPRSNLLFVLAWGTLPQLALVAFVFTPVAMLRNSRQVSFVRAVIVMESSAILSMVLFAYIIARHYSELQSIRNSVFK